MKNNTTFSDEEIQGVVDKLEIEYSDDPLTLRQVLNVAAIVDNFKYNNNEEKLIALEYTAMIRNQIMFYINHIIKSEKVVDYRHKQYITIEGILKRVLMVLYPEREYDLYEIDDKQIKLYTDMMLRDLQVELLERKIVNKKVLKNKKGNN